MSLEDESSGKAPFLIGGENSPREKVTAKLAEHHLSHRARTRPGTPDFSSARLGLVSHHAILVPSLALTAPRTKDPRGRKGPGPSDGCPDRVFPPLKESLHWIVPSPLPTGRRRSHVYMYILSASVSFLHLTSTAQAQEGERPCQSGPNPAPRVLHRSLPAQPLAPGVSPTPKTRGASRQKAGVGFALF